MKLIKIEKWGTFNIGELFDIHPTKAYKLTNSSLMEEDGVNPIVVNSSFNNGIGGYTNQENTEKGGIITLLLMLFSFRKQILWGIRTYKECTQLESIKINGVNIHYYSLFPYLETVL